jgi:hypothetical protein
MADANATKETKKPETKLVIVFVPPIDGVWDCPLPSIEKHPLAPYLPILDAVAEKAKLPMVLVGMNGAGVLNGLGHTHQPSPEFIKRWYGFLTEKISGAVYIVALGMVLPDGHFVIPPEANEDDLSYSFFWHMPNQGAVYQAIANAEVKHAEVLALTSHPLHIETAQNAAVRHMPLKAFCDHYTQRYNLGGGNPQPTNEPSSRSALRELRSK